jgi:hypothetical protein
MGANPIATAPAASKRNERVIVPYRLQRASPKRKNFSRSFRKLALAVSQLLENAELAGINFTTDGRDQAYPNDTDKGRQQNRRVEIVVERAK